MNADDRVQDKDFKASAEYMMTGPEYISYITDR